MDMPPAAVGHNSHDCELAGDIAAARLKFLEMVLKPRVSRRYEIVSRAYASDMSDAEFRVLYGYVHHGNRDACNIYVGQATLGKIAHKGEQAVRRATRSLEADGWLQDAEKQHQKAAVRSASIPAHAMRAILSEVVEYQISTGQPIAVPASLVPQNIDRSNLTGMDQPKTTGLEAKTGQIRQLRPVEFDRRTIEDKPYAPESAPAPTRKIANPTHWAYNAAFDPEERKAQLDVGWTEDGTLVAMNGFEGQLLRDFPRVNLTAGLAAAAGNQLPAKGTATAKQVKGAILRQFGFMEQDEAGRDRRAAARQSATPAIRGAPAPRPSWREEEAAYSKRMADANAAAARKYGTGAKA